MATITINLDDELNEKFRDIIKQKIGEGKGTIGKAVEEAIVSWIEEKKQAEIAHEMMNLMEKGFEMGKIKVKTRESLHER
ncbi:hypothetical protein HYT25_01345 [Candidatus Pacearchaeota archaeon]|nr:hypothetical protein [Candidatus Pacearchaeota archaeon]